MSRAKSGVKILNPSAVLYPMGCRILSRAKSGVKILNPSAVLYPLVGTCAENKPVRLKLQKGVQYAWCSCGLSGKQPWCDGSHKAEGVTTLRPVVFEVEADGEYSMCLCKATEKRPLCDGHHRKLQVRKRRYEGQPQYCAYVESPVYEGVAEKLGYNPKHRRWHF
ncbi:unnamed protein product [Gongylonema pulchrum]|uniref:Iron-binding zinc finger CDGSH type domain-containing protein n=1 Tax=Gongylonema pulchrum TaxID=637853 RepID=A0A3P7MUC2_9BILA|nr:unnamed protein product [Gongylonema pulchrum]